MAMATRCAASTTSGGQGSKPWRADRGGDRWYGRGTADNKGQHALNLAALEAVLAERGGKLGFNVKLVLEMARSAARGACASSSPPCEELAADVLIASDGPRVEPEMPTIATGTRGTWHFDLALKLRPGGVHSGHWGGLTRDPAILLAHALATIGPQRQDPGARLAAAGRRLAGRGARRARWLPGRRRRGMRDDRRGLGRAGPDRPRRSMAGTASSCWR
jgi:acetylornithine deacetylase/succinyl-diaminopimelate desuccinylase-like protein